MPVSLKPHPSGLAGPLTEIEVYLDRREGSLWLRFVTWGDVDRIAWPAAEEAGRADDLWKHTCFECFLRTDDGYHEFNLSPSGQWAAYRFDGYRAGMAIASEAAEVAPLDGAWDMVALEAVIDLPSQVEALGLSAVIEDVNGAKTYWALAHPSDKPDFHHPDSFTLVLPVPEHP